MKLKLLVTRNDAPFCEGVYAVSDAESFGVACSDLWEKLAARKVASARNVGALYDALGDSMAADLKDLRIQLVPLDP